MQPGSDCEIKPGVRKKIVVANLIPSYQITTQFDHCHADYCFHAVATSPDLPGTTYTWKFEVFPNGSGSTTPALTIVATGKDVHLQVPGYQLPGTFGYVITHLAINTGNCGETGTMAFPSYSCNPGRQVIVAPSPTTTGNQVVINITNDYVGASGGLDVRFIRMSTGIVHSTQRIYNNGQPVSTTGFPTGSYTVRAALEDNTVLTTTLIVSDN